MKNFFSTLLILMLLPLAGKAQKTKTDSIIYNFLTYRDEISKDILLVKSYKVTFSSENARYRNMVDSLCEGSINSNEKKNGIIKNKNIRLISLKKRQSIVSQNKNKQSQIKLIVEINSFLQLCSNYYLISYSKYKTNNDAVWTTCVIQVDLENKITEYFYVDSGVQ